MTTFLSRLTAWDFAAITAGWLLIAVALATIPGRAKRAAPPPPTPEPWTPWEQPSNDWMALVSVDCLGDRDPILHERFETLMTGDWFDGTIHYPVLHTHDGGVA